MSATTTTQNLIDTLAYAVATDGLAAHREEITAVADQASAVGVCALLVDVLLDGSEPDVVRERALGAVTRRLAELLACDDKAATTATATAPDTGRTPALV